MKLRKTARAVLLDPQDRVLLFRFELPAGYIAGVRNFWATPGGAIEGGEDVLEALQREIVEETGLQSFRVLQEVWYGTNVITFKGEPIRTHERFFLVRTETAVLGQSAMTPIELQIMVEHRWWPVVDLVATDATIFPPRFGLLVRDILEQPFAGPREIPL